ncbi:MAG: hypothetical protein U0996_17690 [Planctomycetaceae bacterium]
MFHQSMQSWDVAQAMSLRRDRAVSRLEAMELFASCAARDYRSIGHKAIYLANAWRRCDNWMGTRQAGVAVSGVRHPEHNGANPSQNDLAPDRSWRSMA